MRNLILLLGLSFISVTSVFALDKIPDGAVYSDDGTHWSLVSISGNNSVLTIDGVVKSTYTSIDTPFYIGESSFAIAYGEGNITRYLLKDGVLIDSGETIATINDYINTPYGKVVGWYIIGNGSYRLKDTTGKTIFENTNAGSSSYASLLSRGVIQSVVYDKNNINSTLYINDKKVAEGANPIGIYKNKKNLLVPYTLYTPQDITEIYLYDITSGESRKLPSYDGIGTYATIVTKSGELKDLRYTALIGEKYAILDIQGKITSSMRYDSISQFISYGNTFFIGYTIKGELFFSFDCKVYGGYNEIDTFNVSYNSNYTKVKRWSVFVTKNGKDYIVVNGKEFAY